MKLIFIFLHTKALLWVCRLIKAAIDGNAKRKKEMSERILNAVKNIENPKIAVLGLAFKNGTDYCRESPAMEIIVELLEHKANITAYDPKATNLCKFSRDWICL